MGAAVGEGIGTGVAGDADTTAPDSVASVEVVGEAWAGCAEWKVGEGCAVPKMPVPATKSAPSRTTPSRVTAMAVPRRPRVASD